MIQSLAYFVTILRKNFMEYCNEKLQELGLSQGLLFFIIYVGKHPGCTPKELTKSLNMDMGYSARTLAKLVDGGFLLQSVNPRDHRSHSLTLTTAGEKAFLVSYELFSQWDDEIMCRLSGEEQNQLMELLLRLTNEGKQVQT